MTTSRKFREGVNESDRRREDAGFKRNPWLPKSMSGKLTIAREFEHTILACRLAHRESKSETIDIYDRKESIPLNLSDMVFTPLFPFPSSLVLSLP